MNSSFPLVIISGNSKFKLRGHSFSVFCFHIFCSFTFQESSSSSQVDEIAPANESNTAGQMDPSKLKTVDGVQTKLNSNAEFQESSSSSPQVDDINLLDNKYNLVSQVKLNKVNKLDVIQTNCDSNGKYEKRVYISGSYFQLHFRILFSKSKDVQTIQI